MTYGSISNLEISRGSRWGRIQPEGESREIIFNVRVLDSEDDFLSLFVGQFVEFEEHTDFVNGCHAEHVVVPEGMPVQKS